jgi:hypothetical protein
MELHHIREMDALTKAADDARDLVGMTIHQRQMIANPQIDAAADRATEGLRYLDGPTDDAADEFLRRIATSPAAGIEWTHEALSEIDDATTLALLRLALAGNETEVGRLIAQALTAYAIRTLDRRLLERDDA